MRGFILGVIITLVVILGGAYFYMTTGRFDTRAVGNTPSSFERRAGPSRQTGRRPTGDRPRTRPPKLAETKAPYHRNA